MNKLKFGLLQHKPRPQDYIAGGIGVTSHVLDEVPHWIDYLPAKEYQYGTYLDTMACVSFSACNVLETIFNWHLKNGMPERQQEWLEKNGYIVNGQVNFSDRYIAKLSGTTRLGNWYNKVADAVIRYGMVPESAWKFDRSNEARITWERYYEEVPAAVLKLGAEFNKMFKIRYEFIYSGELAEHLKKGPLQIGIYAWSKQINEVYQQRTDECNHAVTFFDKMDNVLIFDHYDQFIKKFVKDYDINVALRYVVDFINNETPMKFETNTLLQEVEKSGAFGLYVDGKLYVDSLDKILASWLVRTKGNTTGKVAAVLEKDWLALPKFNLKNEAL